MTSRTRTALRLPAGGTPSVDRAFPVDDLSALQRAVGGYIQVVRLDAAMRARAEQIAGEPLGDRVFLVVDEEGKNKQRAHNAAATSIVRYHDLIVGDALVVELPEEEPE